MIARDGETVLVDNFRLHPLCFDALCEGDWYAMVRTW
jgi:hypothetical protein